MPPIGQNLSLEDEVQENGIYPGPWRKSKKVKEKSRDGPLKKETLQ